VDLLFGSMRLAILLGLIGIPEHAKEVRDVGQLQSYGGNAALAEI
jgi:hypothetical protein